MDMGVDPVMLKTKDSLDIQFMELMDELRLIADMRKGMPRTKAMKVWEEKRAEFERAKLMRHFE